MLHASLFLPRSIAQYEHPLSARLLQNHWLAESAPAALFLAGCNDRHPPDRIRPYLQNPGRSQSFPARPGCLRNPTTYSEREKRLFRQEPQSRPRPRSTPCAGAPTRPPGNRHTAPRGWPSISRETARSAAWEGAPKKPHWGESSESLPPRRAAAARATVFLSRRFPLPEPFFGAPQSPRSPSSP